MVRFFLELHQAFTHMVKQAKCKVMTKFRCDIVGAVGEITNHLIDTIHAHGGEVVAKGAQIALCIGEESLIDMALNDFTLNFKAFFRQIKHLV